jgi:hypothetical protein
MDASAKKIVNELHAIHRKQIELKQRERALRTALNVMGLRHDYLEMGLFLESKYLDRQPFADKSLPEGCLMILADLKGTSADKNQVEYLLAIGGYPFEAKDPVNSVDVTLRNLAANGKCEVQKGTGSTPNLYHQLPETKE